MTRTCTLAIAALILLAACAGVPLPRESLQAPAALLFNGYANPAANCYHCHGGDGAGTWRGANLVRRVPKLTNDEVKDAILHGKGIMPSFADRLSGDEVDQLVGWLRESYPAPAAPKP